MKNLFFTFIAAVLASACSGPLAEDIQLTFDVTDPIAKNVVLVSHGAVNEIGLDENGHGEFINEGVDAVYARVYYGSQTRLIYLEKGDRARISFDGKNFEGTFAFEGSKAPAVDYLNTIVYTPLPDDSYALPLDEFAEALKRKEQEAVKLMKMHQLKSCGDFIDRETGRIRYMYGNMMLMYPVGHPMMSGDPTWRPDGGYYDRVRDYLVENPKWADLDEYRNFMVELAHILDPESRDVTEPYRKSLAQMSFVADNFKDEKTRQTLINYIAVSYVSFFGIDDIQDMLNLHRTYVSDPLLKAEFQKSYDKWDRAKPGKPSPDFVAADIAGKTYTLADFKGKYVYIDLWATWCNPCRKEFPFLKELEQKFEGAAITFLGLSVDGSKEKWEDMVRSGALSGVQLYLGPRSEFQKSYNIEGIPRFILLDRDGVIINPEMTRPSSEDTAAYLESLEGIR
ncbi:MAG: TlpA family protein disulfide reductase [Bacteroidales bacterium]|nr:TlpA family protein disulfide reductase [Bacteroidales bacterium]